MNWLTNARGQTPQLPAACARRDHERFGVAGGRAPRMDLRSADVTLQELLRVHTTCGLLE